MELLLALDEITSDRGAREKRQHARPLPKERIAARHDAARILTADKKRRAEAAEEKGDWRCTRAGLCTRRAERDRTDADFRYPRAHLRKEYKFVESIVFLCLHFDVFIEREREQKKETLSA